MKDWLLHISWSLEANAQRKTKMNTWVAWKKNHGKFFMPTKIVKYRKLHFVVWRLCVRTVINTMSPWGVTAKMMFEFQKSEIFLMSLLSIICHSSTTSEAQIMQDIIICNLAKRTNLMTLLYTLKKGLQQRCA